MEGREEEVVTRGQMRKIVDGWMSDGVVQRDSGREKEETCGVNSHITLYLTCCAFVLSGFLIVQPTDHCLYDRISSAIGFTLYIHNMNYCCIGMEVSLFRIATKSICINYYLKKTSFLKLCLTFCFVITRRKGIHTF